ncbi:hypothetical protein V5799_031513 [Amblyomma americanum]|uniref:Protein C10 n=1 Tax=Amblyomma americanum TaxID=6943 RepID=A0AAQ4EK73_AMBAM
MVEDFRLDLNSRTPVPPHRCATVNDAEAKGALEDILSAFDQAETFARRQDAKDLAANDMLKHIQVVFPLKTEIEMEVIESYGFIRDGEGTYNIAVLSSSLLE